MHHAIVGTILYTRLHELSCIESLQTSKEHVVPILEFECQLARLLVRELIAGLHARQRRQPVKHGARCE
jgi:hypothetical protein